MRLLTDKKGQDIETPFIWTLRIVVLFVIVAFTFYLWLSAWSVSYDTQSARAYAFQARLEYSGVFASQDSGCTSDASACIQSKINAKPNIIYLSNFKDSVLQNFAYYSPPDKGSNAVVKLYSAPISANITLFASGNGKSFNKTIYLNKDNYIFNYKEYGTGQGNVAYIEARWPVTVYDDTVTPAQVYEGYIYSQVVAR